MLGRELSSRGVEVSKVMWNDIECPEVDFNIFVELVAPQLFKCAREQWVIPNAEWWYFDNLLPEIDKVFAKTKDCAEIFREKRRVDWQNQSKTRFSIDYLGWKALDFYVPEIERERKFLHVAGKSQFKNTDSILRAWRNIDSQLTVVSEYYRPKQKNVTWIQRVTDEEMVPLMNSHLFHIMPSAYEGYGHVLHEGLGVGAIVITTDAPPMNECSAAIMVPYDRTKPYNSASLHYVSPDAIMDGVSIALNMTDMQIELFRERAREQFRLDREVFEKNLDVMAGVA
jgi:hypothetical protein